MILFYQPLNPYIWLPLPASQSEASPAGNVGTAQ